MHNDAHVFLEVVAIIEERESSLRSWTVLMKQRSFAQVRNIASKV